MKWTDVYFTCPFASITDDFIYILFSTPLTRKLVPALSAHEANKLASCYWHMEHHVVIETTNSAWKAEVLPLN